MTVMENSTHNNTFHSIKKMDTRIDTKKNLPTRRINYQVKLNLSNQFKH